MTEQADFWSGEFGDLYISRNESSELLASNLHFFSKILSRCATTPDTYLELGANIGMNAKAIKLLSPSARFTGLEINESALSQLRENADEAIHSSIEGMVIDSQYDFVFTKGVLIHLNPESLNDVYEKMYMATKRWLLVAEYYNPTPVSIEYRGHKNKLFKRDFAGELLTKFPKLVLRDYGFSYHSASFPQDDISWFLMEKRSD